MLRIGIESIVLLTPNVGSRFVPYNLEKLLILQ